MGPQTWGAILRCNLCDELHIELEHQRKKNNQVVRIREYPEKPDLLPHAFFDSIYTDGTPVEVAFDWPMYTLAKAIIKRKTDNEY